jgi:putative PIN family toxin of toxin-antitoxin system
MPSSRKRVLRVVLDANVWVSALLWGGKPAEIVKLAELGKIRIFASEEIVREISQVLAYPKLKKVYQASGLSHEELIEAVLKTVKFAKADKKVNVVLEHPADDKFIECALAAGASYIVSGDKHLLKVGAYKKIQILSVHEFLSKNRCDYFLRSVQKAKMKELWDNTDDET